MLGDAVTRDLVGALGAVLVRPLPGLTLDGQGASLGRDTDHYGFTLASAEALYVAAGDDEPSAGR